MGEAMGESNGGAMGESNEWSVDDDPLAVYLSLVGQVPPLDSSEESACMDHVRAGDEMAARASKRLVEANLHLVVSLAERYRSHEIYILDLIERGNAGLLRAVRSLTDSVPESFTAYATPFIERALAETTASPTTIPPHKK
jgi:DNA-directed RNA polymerase sigma subunit (sigma70/sigma32)